MSISLRFVHFPLLSFAFLCASAAGAQQLACPPPVRLDKAVSLEMVKYHQMMLNEIAKQNGGNRVTGSAGHQQSVDYVSHWLRSAGYTVTTQAFEAPYFEELSDPSLGLVESGTEYPPNVPEGFATAFYSAAGEVSAAAQMVDVLLPIGDNPPNTSTSGCEPEDFAGFVPGSIAVLQRGTCPFGQKAANAASAGAVGAIIFNEGQEGRVDAYLGSLGEPSTIPVVMANHHIGEELNALSQGGSVVVHLKVDAFSEILQTQNVIAETAEGGDAHTVVVGAHLDSAGAGPGINDNASGSAAILETACRMGWLKMKPKYKVRFAFWSAEEQGLLGSSYYVENLSDEELSKISMNLNFDMIASPNFVRFVYDGDGSASEIPGPTGSEVLEQFFVDYFAGLGLPSDPADLDGRSDFYPFMAVGIPVGGLFAGADSVKTEEQAQRYGGVAGEVCDACYHTDCDNVENLNYVIEKQILKAMASAVQTYSETPLVTAQSGATPMFLSRSGGNTVREPLYRGPMLVK